MVVAVTLAVTHFIVAPVVTVAFMPGDIRLTTTEIENRQAIAPSTLIQSNYDPVTMTDDGARTWVNLKLFGLIPIKRVMVDVLPYESVLAGGIPIGFVAKTDGVIVLKDTKDYKRGDVITKYNSANITSVADLERHLNGKRLGLWVKDDTSGVGTLTYINPENNNYAALGHKLVDFETGAVVNLRSGQAYACNVNEIRKSTQKNVGLYDATLKKTTPGVQGSVLSSNNRGVFGCLNDNSILLELCRNNKYPVASRYSVTPGKATILTALDGENIREYKIEIVKTRFQKNKADKGMYIRITDKELLKKTGGIVQGMSGSPIIQNGHIVGAVTHVISGNVTHGYGVYIDFVLP